MFCCAVEEPKSVKPLLPVPLPITRPPTPPTELLVGSVLWIPTFKLDARLTTSIVALLSLIAYNFVFEGDIPKLDYLTDLDKFILLSYIFCCIPTFSSIGFSRFIKKSDKLQKKVTKINSIIRKWGGLIYLLITFQIFYSVPA